MNIPPHPHTWTTAHLQRLEAEVLAFGEKQPTDEQIDTFAAELVGAPEPEKGRPVQKPRHPHIESATYDRGLKRICVVLHGNMVAFPVPLYAEEKSKKAREEGAPTETVPPVLAPVP
jgi:hypothetical protein